MLLVAGYGTPADPKDLEERVVEALRLAFFVGRVAPIFGEAGSPRPNLIPGQSHRVLRASD